MGEAVWEASAQYHCLIFSKIGFLLCIWLQSILQFHYVLAASLFAFRLTGDREYYLIWVTNISVCIVKKKTFISNAGSDICDYIYTLQTLSKLFFTMTDKSITYVQHINNIWFFTYQCFTCNFKGFHKYHETYCGYWICHQNDICWTCSEWQEVRRTAL